MHASVASLRARLADRERRICELEAENAEGKADLDEFIRVGDGMDDAIQKLRADVEMWKRVAREWKNFARREEHSADLWRLKADKLEAALEPMDSKEYGKYIFVLHVLLSLTVYTAEYLLKQKEQPESDHEEEGTVSDVDTRAPPAKRRKVHLS